MNGDNNNTGTSAAPTPSLSKSTRDNVHSPQRPTKIARNGEQAAQVEVGEVGESEGIESSVSLTSDQTMCNLQPSRLQRYLLAIEYVGTNFFGSQKQPSCRTVVGALEEAFEKFIGQPVSIFCSSRTDAGVHALSNVCHVDVERISKRKPGEVEASKVLIGRHDFSSFRAAGCQANSPERTLEELSIWESVSATYFPSASVAEQRDDGANAVKEKVESVVGSSGDGSTGVFGIRRGHRCLVVKARARSFLYHQVRLLVGVLKAVGTGDLTTSDVQRILDAKNVTAASAMAPACGLYLGQVKYDLP